MKPKFYYSYEVLCSDGWKLQLGVESFDQVMPLGYEWEDWKGAHKRLVCLDWVIDSEDPCNSMESRWYLISWFNDAFMRSSAWDYSSAMAHGVSCLSSCGYVELALKLLNRLNELYPNRVCESFRL